ncbi:hypothetical protein BU15DRAFT_58374 [Melanogaster broomeanus]|nr:hypothetical protein BU15DRAFT_58374 [Melanogaster broomeanus]
MSALNSRWSIARPHADDLDQFKSKSQNIEPFFQALRISSIEFKQFQVTLRSLAQQYLDIKEQFQGQEQWRIDNLMRQVPEAIPWITDFQDAWPVAVYLTRYLRNMNESPSRRPKTRNYEVRAVSSNMHLLTEVINANFCSLAGEKGTNHTWGIPYALQPRSGPLKKLLESARPSLEVFLPNFVKVGIDTIGCALCLLRVDKRGARGLPRERRGQYTLDALPEGFVLDGLQEVHETTVKLSCGGMLHADWLVFGRSHRCMRTVISGRGTFRTLPSSPVLGMATCTALATGAVWPDDFDLLLELAKTVGPEYSSLHVTDHHVGQTRGHDAACEAHGPVYWKITMRYKLAPRIASSDSTPALILAQPCPRVINHLQKIISERRAVFARPKVSDIIYMSKTLLSIDAYFDACKIDAEKFEAVKNTPTLQFTMRNLTLMYLQEDVPIDKQNESTINSLIQHIAESHEWLSAYEGCWPAQVYLNRYWRNRLVHRRSTSDKVVEGTPRRRRGRPANREGEAASNPRTTPAQKRIYPLRRQVQRRRSASAPGDDDKSDSAASFSSSEDSVSELHDRKQSEAPLCDEVDLNARQKSTFFGAPTLKNFALSSTAGPSLRGASVPPRSHNKPSNTDTEAVKQFLKSLKPCLESRLDVFIELGIRNHETLVAFLSWPPATQAQWVDEGNEALQLTRLERGALLVGCSMFAQSVLYGTA